MTESVRWSVQVFRELVELRFGTASEDRAGSAASALAQETKFARYHIYRSNEIATSVEFGESQANETEGMSVLRQLLLEAEPGERERPLSRARFESCAH